VVHWRSIYTPSFISVFYRNLTCFLFSFTHLPLIFLAHNSEGWVLPGLYSPHTTRGSLVDAARSEVRLAERDICAYVGDMVRGLAYLHGLSLVHGDVKAKNKYDMWKECVGI
jgi:serine/threonine protein kinase